MSRTPTETIPRIRAALSRDFYISYLNSSSWRTRRRRALELANWRCSRCGSKRDLQVHHTSYERLGAEWDQDLEVLCADCHEAHHEAEAERSDLGLYLRLVRQAIAAQPLASIADLSEHVKRLCVTYRIPCEPSAIHRALELGTGQRFVRPTPKPRRGRPSSVDPISAQEAHEILKRLRIAVSFRSMR